MGDADELGGGETFAAIGAAYAVAGEHSKSITYFRRAEMMVKKKDPALTAIAGQSPYALADLNSWGMSLDALDRLDEAADRYEVALQVCTSYALSESPTRSPLIVECNFNDVSLADVSECS
eukprot:SAG31_NODE_190_length_20810_cov_20.296364_21_plen_121_part_00